MVEAVGCGRPHRIWLIPLLASAGLSTMGCDARQFGRLAAWSFLMATARGAGLMLFPKLIDLGSMSMSTHLHHTMTMAMPAHASLGVEQTLAIALLHTTTMLLVMGTVAFAVYSGSALKFCAAAGSTSTRYGQARWSPPAPCRL
jgi:hypothetical protein